MKIAAFNVQRLGRTKVNKEDVREIIIKIVSRYSVVVLVEVADQSGEAMDLLLQHLNAYGDNRSNPYGMLCSEPLGPEGHMEKFVYFYRKKEVEIIQSHQKGENAEDVITRQPFMVLLNCSKTVVQDLVLIPVHTNPSNAEAELNALHDVVEGAREMWQTDNIMILGDFNADEPYLSNEQKEALRISSARYHWLIDDDVNTTTSNNNNHTYDRIVVYGESMLEAIVPDSAKAYNFKRELNLTQEKTLSVSDHYPVEVEVELKVEPEVELMMELKVKPEVELEVELEVEPEVELEVEPEVELEVEPELELKVKPEVELEVMPEVELEVKPEVELEVKPEVELEEQMEKLTMEQKAQRNRNPVRPSTGGRPPVKMKIAAFNVQKLEWTKVNKEGVLDNIIKIISRYSVVVLVEVTDLSGEAMPLLLDHLNDYGDNIRNPYKMECSDRSVGSKGHEEKFVYFYRKKEVEEITPYQYEGNAGITRQPYIVRLNFPNTVVQDLVLIPVHTKTSNTEAELNALHDVVEDVRERWKNDNIMILGDFNADRPYLYKKKKEALRISSAPYHWLIDDDVDTTTTKKKKGAYDRIVVYGESMLEAIVPNSAKAYNFEEELELTEEQALRVSDRYPVEVELKVKPEVELKVKPEVELELELEVEVEVMVKLMVDQIRKLELMLKQEMEQMMKQMRKVEVMVEKMAERKRNPV